MSDTDIKMSDIVPEGAMVLDFVVSVKALDADGTVIIINGRSPGLSQWEAIGMFTVALDDLRAHTQSIVTDEGGDDD